MDADFLKQSGQFILDPQYSNLLFLNFKMWALQYVPQNESETLNKAFKENDLDTFMMLVTKYVPDLQTKVIELVKGASK